MKKYGEGEGYSKNNYNTKRYGEGEGNRMNKYGEGEGYNKNNYNTKKYGEGNIFIIKIKCLLFNDEITYIMKVKDTTRTNMVKEKETRKILTKITNMVKGREITTKPESIATNHTVVVATTASHLIINHMVLTAVTTANLFIKVQARTTKVNKIF